VKLDGWDSTYILIPAQSLTNITRRKLVELLVVAEDDHGNVDGAEYGQLVGLLEEAPFSLEEGAGAGETGSALCARTSRSAGKLTQSDCDHL